jgi:hypothetical protein
MRIVQCSFFVAFLAIASAAVGDGFHWGVNGHPGAQEGYRQVPIIAQLDLIVELGAKWYRCDWSEGAFCANPAVYDTLVDEATRRGVCLLPVIFPDTSCRSDRPLAEIRAGAEKFARALVGRYRGRISHWELDNELDNWAMVHKGEKCPNGLLWQWGDPHGNDPNHFQEDRYQKARAELEGLHAGVKAADPTAKTIVDSCWIHYGFIERLLAKDRVPIDILGWHWYSEMGDPAKANSNINLPEHLKRFGRPIWFTELNYRGGSLGNKHAEQADYLVKLARQLRATPGVEAMFVYELLDEPYFGPDNPESHYGLVELQRGSDGQWQIGRRKPGFSALRAVIGNGSR